MLSNGDWWGWIILWLIRTPTCICEMCRRRPTYHLVNLWISELNCSRSSSEEVSDVPTVDCRIIPFKILSHQGGVASCLRPKLQASEVKLSTSHSEWNTANIFPFWTLLYLHCPVPEWVYSTVYYAVMRTYRHNWKFFGRPSIPVASEYILVYSTVPVML